MKIWRDYDQAGLDGQYGTRDQIGDQYESWTERWRRESEAARAAFRPVLDIAYGPHPRQRLDLFAPHRPTGHDPVVMFFHGGFWRSRDKADYSYVANGLSGLGYVTAVVNYPLCPADTLDTVVESARLAGHWLLRNAAQHGGDPSRLYVSGHSAGAHLAVMMFCGGAAELPAGAIKGAVVTSGIYELEPVRLCFANADVRLDEAQVARLSPVRLPLAGLQGPVLVAYGTAETEEFAYQANLLTGRLARE